MVHSMGTRLEFMPSANRVPKLFCERMNHVCTGLKRLTGKILEHWGSLRFLRDYLEANVRRRAESEHPAWEGCQERRPLHSPVPGAPRTPASRGMSPPPEHDCTLRVSARRVHLPYRRAWISEPDSERGVERLEVSLVAAIKVTDRLGRGSGRQERCGEDRLGPST